jgi:polysaccharide biosynthesis/export protein
MIAAEEGVMRTLPLVLALTLVSPACSVTHRSPGPSEQPRHDAKLAQLFRERAPGKGDVGYPVGPGDSIRIAAPRASELTGDYVVGRDGKVSLPLVGMAHVAGKTDKAIAEDIRRRLAEEYLQNPEVIVTVAGYGGHRVSVLGAVQNPGFYELRGNGETILDMTLRAGGVAPSSGPRITFTPGKENSGAERRIAVARGIGLQATALLASGGREPLEIDLTNLYEGREVPALKLPVRHGDTIFVQEGGDVVVGGWVGQPNVYELQRAMTLTQAVSKAGGIHFGGSPRRATLSREDGGGTLHEYPVNYSMIESGSEEDIYLQAGDRIQIAANPFKAGVWGIYNFVVTIVSIGIGGSIGLF